MLGALARSSTGGLSPQLAVSGYQGVVRHLRPTGKPYFEARARGVTVSSCHATDVEAAMVVAKKRRVSVKSLKKKQPLTDKLATALFQSSYRVFRSYVPGDLDNALHLEKANAKIYSQDLRSCELDQVMLGCWVCLFVLVHTVLTLHGVCSP